MTPTQIDAASSSRSDMLRDVRGFIERGWTQGECALNATGHIVASNSPTAVCWCLAGAFEAIGDGSIGTAAIWDVQAQVLGFADHWGMINWNDEPGRTQAEVLARIDQALERAGGGE